MKIRRICCFAALAALIPLCACAPETGDGGEHKMPDAEYTIDESVMAGKDANAAEFYASNVVKREDSPLEGKIIYWLGSSVTYGASSGGESMVEFLAARTGAICRKEAVSGTTIFDDGKTENTGEKSYTRRLTSSKIFGKDGEYPDAFICQISTNDAIDNRLSKRGEMTGPEVYDPDAFDRSTTLGGVEFIISYVLDTWGCPVYFYSGSYFGDTGTRASTNPSGTEYAKLVGQVKEIAEKWKALGNDVEVLDLYNDADFNAQVSDEYYKWCTSDAIHPKRAGYLNWWMPRFEQFLTYYLDV